MKGQIIADWSKVDLKSKSDSRKVLGALQYFFNAPFKKDAAVAKAMQHFTTKGDFPTEILQVLEKYHATNDFDMGYQDLFDIRDFTGSNVSGFDILDVSDGLTFSEVKVGEKAKVYGMSGSKVSVSFSRLGGGLNWDRTLIEDKQYWTLEDNAIAFRNKSQQAKAAAHYALIEALGSGYNVSWEAVTPSGVANTDRAYLAIRDANTINAACQAILLALKDSGMGITASTVFTVLAPIQLKGRIERALALKAEGYAGAVSQMNYAVRPQYTTMLAATDKYYVMVPKMKMKGGNRMDLTVFSDFDALAYADTIVGWMRFGAGIGDSNQLRRCSIA